MLLAQHGREGACKLTYGIESGPHRRQHLPSFGKPSQAGQHAGAHQRGLAAAGRPQQQEQALARAALEPHALHELDRDRDFRIATDEHASIGLIERDEPGIGFPVDVQIEHVGQRDLQPCEGVGLVAREVEVLRVAEQAAVIGTVDAGKDQPLALLAP